MTGAQAGDFGRPGPVSAIRDRLAEALRHLLASDDATMYYDAPHAVWNAGDRYADALLPVVESLAVERAAEALEAAADSLTVAGWYAARPTTERTPA